MPTRKYEKRLRAESAEETRRRILDAVGDRLRHAPTTPLNLDSVAQEARVSRSTIYLVFGSRAGLLDAFVEDLWARTGLAALTEAVATTDARQHLRAGIAASSRMWAADRDIYRVLFSMAQLDPASVGAAVTTMETERAGGMEHLARRLEEDSVLRDGVTVAAAIDVLWMLCSFDVLDLLMTGRGLDVEAAVGIIVDTVERAICR